MSPCISLERYHNKEYIFIFYGKNLASPLISPVSHLFFMKKYNEQRN